MTVGWPRRRCCGRRRRPVGSCASRADLGVVLAGLTGTAVVAFLLKESARVSVGAAKGRVTELRSLLKFLYLTGPRQRRWLARSRQSRAGATPACRPPFAPRRCNGRWTAATAPARSASATTRS